MTKDLDKKEALKLLSGLAIRSSKEKKFERTFSHEMWNEVAYLERNDLVETETAENGFRARIKDNSALGKANGALAKSGLFYDGGIESLPAEAIEIEGKQDETIEDYSLENAEIYHSIIYAFGRGLNKGKDLSLREDILRQVVGQNISEQLQVLESTNYLESKRGQEEKLYQIVNNEEVREWSKDIAQRIDENYDSDVERYMRRTTETEL